MFKLFDQLNFFLNEERKNIMYNFFPINYQNMKQKKMIINPILLIEGAFIKMH